MGMGESCKMERVVMRKREWGKERKVANEEKNTPNQNTLIIRNLRTQPSYVQKTHPGHTQTNTLISHFS